MVAAWAIEIGFDLAALAVALLGLAILAAMFPLADLVRGVLVKLPWPLAQMGTLGFNAMLSTIQQGVRWADASAEGLATAIRAPWQAIWTVERQVVESQEHLFWAIWRVRYQSIPNLYQWARSGITSSFQASVAIAQQIGQAAIAHSNQLAAALQALTLRVRAEALAHSDQLAGLLQALLLARFAQAIGYTTSVGRTAIAHSDQLAGVLEALMAARFGQAIAHADQLAAVLQALQRALFSQAIDYTRTVAGTLQRDLQASEARSAARAVALAAPLAVAIQAIQRSPCMRVCGPLGDLGGLLQELSELGAVGVILALAAESAQDPAAAAGAVRSVLGPLTEDATASARAMVGR